ncbi:MAG: hypothetical protein JXR78_13020 [Victivallales bacterium]|nr:hypothetical protein [Victivallales bacterium]
MKKIKFFMFLFFSTFTFCVFAGAQDNISDDEFLDMVSRACFKFFWNESAPETFLSRDNTKFPHVYSIASTGFGLSAMVIGAERGYKPEAEVKNRVLAVLKTVNASKKRKGMLFHYLNSEGQPSLSGYENVASTIDTALLLMGAISAGEYFGGEIAKEAELLYKNVNWKEFVDPDRRLIKMAWQPQNDSDIDGDGHFHRATWDYYSDESIIVTLLAISAPEQQYRVEGDFFYRWVRSSGAYKPKTPGLKQAAPFVFSWSGALFTYQFAHLWVDFKQLGRDMPSKFNLHNIPAINWYENTINATISSRQFCIDRSESFKSFGYNSWGLTACACANGYYVGGFSPRGDQAPPKLDGTLAPYGAGTAIMFLPEESIGALRYYYGLQDKNGNRLVWNNNGNHYGFADSFNLDTGYVAREYLGIDQGPMLLAIENYRSGLIQKMFMKNKYIRQGLKRIGFSKLK